MRILLALGGCIVFLAGCATPPNPNAESGPDGTIVFRVPIESSEPGAKVEVNGETVGNTPMVLKVFGDRDGSFHNFGSYDFIVRVYPPGTGRSAQTKVYKTGALLAHEDKIPEKIFFDFGTKP